MITFYYGTVYVIVVVPPPVPSGNMSGFTTEQLQQIEGQERSAVETRLKVLRDIQALLDVAVIQMSQYQNIVAMEKYGR